MGKFMQSLSLASAKIKGVWEGVRAFRNWYAWLLARAYIWPFREITFRMKDGVRLIAPNTAEGLFIVSETWRKGVYARHFDPQQGDVILDVGANFGTFSVFAASKANDVRIVAFEPSSKTRERLMRNVSLNHFEQRIKVVPVALGNEDGGVILYRPERNPGAATVFKDRVEPSSLPDITEERIEIRNANIVWEHARAYDFAKFDCEGSEYDIFETLGDSIRRIKKIVMEYHGGHERIEKFLIAHGFEILEIIPHSILGEIGMLYALRKDE